MVQKTKIELRVPWPSVYTNEVKARRQAGEYILIVTLGSPNPEEPQSMQQELVAQRLIVGYR